MRRHCVTVTRRCGAAEVGAVHPKAMPVILTKPDDVQRWLTVETAELPSLQRPLPDGTLQVIDPED